MRRLFHTAETVFLAGGKKWILGGDKPTVADIMGRPPHPCLPSSLTISISY